MPGRKLFLLTLLIGPWIAVTPAKAEVDPKVQALVAKGSFAEAEKLLEQQIPEFRPRRRPATRPFNWKSSAAFGMTLR